VRLALISDVHANLAALDATILDIAGQSVDCIVCLGDVVGYNGQPAECVRRIREAGAICVAGNHDLAVCGLIGTKDFPPAAASSVAWTRTQLAEDDLNFLRGLPRTIDIGDELVAVHGALHPERNRESVRLDNDWRRLLTFQALVKHPSGASICAYGHTHHARIYESRSGFPAKLTETEVRLREDAYYLINPGTVGEPRTDDRRASYMVLDLARRILTLRHVEYEAGIPFIAAREANLAPRFGASLKQKLRSIIKV